MAEIKINGTLRTEFGKGASRRARRDGLVPAVIYGHGEKQKKLALP
jgi:large subunit ribosomal protein L25